MITFKSLHATSASGRYRGIIVTQELSRAGYDPPYNWLVIGKHDWDWDEQTKGFDKVCFDVCDNHFGTYRDGHYRNGIEKATFVTCNSHEMARVILTETGKEAVVIPDPYEQPERAPRVHDQLLWFGYKRTMVDLLPYLGKLSNLTVVTDLEGHTEPRHRPSGYVLWSPEEMDRTFSEAGLVILPTGISMAKSGNRAIESIRRGLFVVAGYLPAYSDLGIYIGNIYDGVEWALSHKMDVLKRIKASQDYVRDQYSPKRIAGLWMKAINERC